MSSRAGMSRLPPALSSQGVSACCDPRGCDRFFNPRFARRMAKRYRRRGPDKTAREMVAFLERRGLGDLTVLEIGGGLGEIALDLLKRGARSAVNLELSPAYDAEAAQLVREAGLEGRMQRRLHDLAADPGGAEPADIVVLHRVVCCYPDYERLLGAAAEHARRLLVFSHPPRNPLSRAIAAISNLSFRVRGSEFRAFTHPPEAMVGVLESRGLRPAFTYDGPVWHVVGLERAASDA